jgi:hypothetical protein
MSRIEQIGIECGRQRIRIHACADRAAGFSAVGAACALNPLLTGLRQSRPIHLAFYPGYNVSFILDPGFLFHDAALL